MAMAARMAARVAAMMAMMKVLKVFVVGREEDKRTNAAYAARWQTGDVQEGVVFSATVSYSDKDGGECGGKYGSKDGGECGM
jgi:hypothetical protein